VTATRRWLARRAIAAVRPAALPLLLRVVERIGRGAPALERDLTAARLTTLAEVLETPRESLRAPVAARWLVGRVVRGWVSLNGVAPTGPLITWDEASAARIDAARARGPVIVAMWHWRLSFLVPAALWALGIDSLVGRTALPPDAKPEPWTRTTLWAPEDRLRFVADAVARLRAGDVVVLALDGRIEDVPQLTVPFLGRPARIGRGAGALARLTGATLVPMVVGWEPPRGLVARAGEAVALPPDGSPEERESAALAEVVAQMERWARERPDRLCPWAVTHLAEALQTSG